MSAPPFDRHPRFQRLHAYLTAKAPPGKLPGRQHIDPLEIPDLLPYLMLIDVLAQPDGEPRFRYRLVGTAVVDVHGQDVTGKFADQVLTGRGAATARFGTVVTSRQPQHYIGEFVISGREHASFERVAFPLARDGETVDMLIIVFVLHDRPDG